LKMAEYDLPNNYGCQDYYVDVRHNSLNNWICRAVEIGADA